MKSDKTDPHIAHPFKTPDDYFDNLYAVLIASKRSKKTEMQWQPVFRLSFAMALFLFFALVFVTDPFRTESPEQILSEISDEEIAAYLVAYELNEFDPASLLNEQDDLDFEIEDPWYDLLKKEDEEDMYLEFGIDQSDYLEI